MTPSVEVGDWVWSEWSLDEASVVQKVSKQGQRIYHASGGGTWMRPKDIIEIRGERNGQPFTWRRP